jgi:hypothetical protein
MQYRLSTLLIVLALGPPVLWMGSNLRISPPMSTQTISTLAELDELLAAKRAIIHMDVDWAVQAVASRPFVDRLRDALAADPAFHGVLFRRIDCTNQEGPLWNAVKSWCESNRMGHSPYAGYGTVLCVENGEVRDIAINAAATGDRNLLTRTHEAFGKK